MKKSHNHNSGIFLLLEKAAWGLWFLTILALAVTGLVAFATGRALSGYLLLLHVAGGGAFAFFLLAALVAALHRSASLSDRRPMLAWLLLSATGLMGAITVFSAVINMFPLLGTETQELFLVGHELAGLGVSVLAPFCYRAFFIAPTRRPA